MDYKIIKLKPKKEDALRRFHPWVFSGAIARKAPSIEEGEVVKVVSAQDEFLAVGHYQSGSIEVRILAFEDIEINLDFWTERITEAYLLRKALKLGNEENSCYRLVHGEGDSLPSLVIDIYGNTAVMQAHSTGMHIARMEICSALRRVLGEALEFVYYKSETTLPLKVAGEAEAGYLFATDGKIPAESATENGLHFEIDWLKGQKTGFFVDQRTNRQILESYSNNRRVLNMFCYTGGFSVYALRGGASAVDSVDSSERAIRITENNVALNFPDEIRHKAIAADAFKYLAETPKGKYDLLILDPPAFAKHLGAVKNALQGYKRLNAAAFEILPPRSFLFTFSCSQVIDKNMFRTVVFSAAAIAKRKVRILHQLTQSPDHPVNIYHPEGEYLKGLVLYVE